MSIDFGEFLSELGTETLEETPVGIDEFLNGEDYLNRPEIKLSDLQRICILASTQIYKKETLLEYMTPDEADRRWKQTKNEVILALGKGSGKDLLSAISCCYIVYLLLCLKDPAKYYGKPSGDSIDLLNIAVNANQASNVFFANVSRLVQASPWFRGRYLAKMDGKPQRNDEISFDQNITLYSGHSEREAWEGYNLIFVVLDEISAFASSAKTVTVSESFGKTSEAIYNMYRASVDSRFANFGKVVLLSFPRHKGDFILHRYNAVLRDKIVIKRQHTFKLDPDLPDDMIENKFMIEWEEDQNLIYKFPNVFALRRPTWEMNPTTDLDSPAMVAAFYNNKTDSLARFACMPSEAVDAFFKDSSRIDECFVRPNGVDEEGRFRPEFKPKEDKDYYIHVDLAKKHDHCAVGLAHVENWRQHKIMDTLSEAAPLVILDAIRWWTPTKDKSVDFAEVREYIVSLQRRGFSLRLVTFDQWQSEDMRKSLESVGIKTEKLSVGKNHYTDLKIVIHEGRFVGPDVELLKNELLRLRITPDNKVEASSRGTDDLADATCGAVYNAIKHTKRDTNTKVEIQTLSSIRKETVNELELPRNTITAPKRMPKDLEDFFSNMEVL